MPTAVDEPILETPLPVEGDRSLSCEGLERINIAPSGKRFKAWFMTPGIINYEDCKNGGQELLRKETVDEYLNSLIGTPLTIRHVPTDAPVDIDRVNGRIDKVGFDADKGWHYCEGEVETDQARNCIRDGWGISVGMRALAFSGRGMWLNNPYDREIKKIRFHHLAIVPPDEKPRIDEAEIRLNSTAKQKPMSLVKWIRKVVGADGKTTEEARELPIGTKLAIGGGATASVSDLVDHERLNHCHAVCEDDYIEHEGVRYHVGTMVKHMKDKMAGGTASERLNAVEKAIAEVTSIPDAEKLVSEAAERLNAVKLDVEKATADKNAEALAEAQKTLSRVEKISSLATERLNSLKKAADDKAAAEKAAADKKAKEDAEAAERQNAINKAAAEKAAADKLAAEKAEADRKAEEERVNAARRAGAESFAILAGASERGVQKTFPAPSAGISDKLAKGRKLFGSDSSNGKN